jgi:hypothetical protein
VVVLFRAKIGGKWKNSNAPLALPSITSFKRKRSIVNDFFNISKNKPIESGNIFI